MRKRTILTLTGLLVLMVSACEPSADTASEADADSTAQMTETMTADELPDTTGAAVWAYLQQANYRDTWTTWPDKGELYAGTEPHGSLLTTYLNETALNALNGDATMMPAGAIIVKENYMPDSTLAAITVMHKVPGYNAAHNDWFFSKHLPSGELDQMNGMALEGRVQGCQSCHSQRKDNDYLLTADLNAAGM